MHSDRRRLLDKLLRELVRSESNTIEQAEREARRLGDAAPVVALREVSAHALEMRPRFALVVAGHHLAAARGGISATLAVLRRIVAGCVYDPERSFHGALLELRHGIDLVRVLREVARLDELFGLIRWCDDWLGGRRILVARVEAQLCWFAAQPAPVVAEDPEQPPAHERQ